MIELNNVYVENCFNTMERMVNEGVKVNKVITSPFYNTSRGSAYHNTEKARENYEGRYDIHLDNLTDEGYIEFTVKLFEYFDQILEKDGCIIYNINYGGENSYLLWLVIAEIIKRTNFVTADDIIWKKGSALPNNVSPNKLTRIVEHVFVFSRKSEFKTFTANKEVTSVRKTGQKMYANYFNFIEAKNNDKSNKLNKATYSTDLMLQLMSLYCKQGETVYDPMSGTLTTQNACLIYGCNYLGSELSEAQVSEGLLRLEETRDLLKSNHFTSWDEYSHYIANAKRK